MTSILNFKGSFILSSIYDGQKYFDKEYSLQEVENLEKSKRENFIAKGYDVEDYEKKYHDLIQERQCKSVNAKDIWEREKITLKYNQKIKDLAKEYLDVDFDIVTKIKWDVIMTTDEETLKRDKLLLELMTHVYDEDERRNELVDSKNSQMIVLSGAMLTLQSTLISKLLIEDILLNCDLSVAFYFYINFKYFTLHIF